MMIRRSTIGDRGSSIFWPKLFLTDSSDSGDSSDRGFLN